MAINSFHIAFSFMSCIPCSRRISFKWHYYSISDCPALTLLSISEHHLRLLDFEGILKYFRVTLPKTCRNCIRASRIMKMACDRKIKKFKQYEDEFMLKKQDKERIEKENQIYENRFGAERRKLQTEMNDLQQKLADAKESAIEKKNKHTGIIHDYKQIIQRLEQDMTTLNVTLGTVTNTISKCSNCSQHIQQFNQTKSVMNSTNDNFFIINNNRNANESPLGPLDPLHSAQHRIRELELELAQAKLAQVEAECKNQDLNHQLSTTMTEMQSNRNSWQPFLSKTLNFERGTRDTQPTAIFQSYMSATGSESNSPSGQ